MRFFICSLEPAKKCPFRRWHSWCTFCILSRTRTFTDWPKNSEGRLRQRVYRKWKTNLYEAKEIHDPIAGCLIKRIYRPSNCMAARKSEIVQIVDRAYQETKGEGARKLKVRTSHYYSGLSRNAIQKKLNVMKKPQKLRPLFENKALLRPILRRAENKKGARLAWWVWRVCQRPLMVTHTSI